MTFDPRTKKLYWSYVSTKNKSYLYEINYNIGQVKATKLMQIPDNAYLVNMYIAPMEAADDAPAAVSDLQLSFEGEQTTGIVAFTMPTKTYSGDDLSGELTYSIYVDDSVLVATSTAQAGAQVAKVVSVPSEGRIVEVKVVAKNAAGEGAAKTAQEHGLRKVAVFVKGPGSGRETAIRSLQAAGLEIASIQDCTPIPHNGCRQRKRRRV
jgi:hypothetical protein